MYSKPEDKLLSECLLKIESQLNWGLSEDWSTHDFEKLSELILTKTSTHLSVTTLKRLWGKVQYQSQPTITTLNTIAQFSGQQSWRDFAQTNGNNSEITASNMSSRLPVRGIKNIRGLLLAVFLSVGLFIFFFTMKSSQSPIVKSDQFAFSSQKMVSEGVPNSVIFNYDASAAGHSQQIYIQQSWDEKLRDEVNIDEKIHTSIYYLPGFFIAKLVVGDKIVKEHNIFIKTNGWLGLIEKEAVPVYFERNEVYLPNGRLGLDQMQVENKNIKMQPVTPWISLFNVRDFGDLYADNFIFETQIKNTYNEGANICQDSQIHLLFDGGALMIPLSIPGCVSALEFYDNKGKQENPAALGVNLSDWVDITIEFKGEAGKLYVNNQFAYKLNYAFHPKKIIGLRYRFKGVGEVKSVKLSKGDGKVVYEEAFRKEITN